MKTVSGKVVTQSIAFRVVSIYWQGDGYGPKIVGAVPLWGSWVTSNTMWPGPRPTCVPSFILIRPTVWPQYTNVTERTDRQTDRQTDRTDNGPIA